MEKHTTLSNYLAGRWENSKSDSFLEVHNPATGEVISEVPISSKNELDLAVQKAREAFKSWRRVPVTERIQYLFKLKQLLEENLDEIAQTITREAGKTIHESRGEMRRAIENVEVACGTPSLMQGYNNEDISSGIDEIMIRQPIGVAGIIAPFNFPGMIPFWYLPYAIACGNTCIVKPSERVPNTMSKVFELIDQLDLPDGVINMVHGNRIIAEAMLEHKGIDSISFVGSTPVAKAVYAKAAKHGKRVQASGGAKNPIIFLPDADPEMSTQIAIDSAFGCAGQRCLAASLAITVGKSGSIFKEALAERASDLNVGDGLDESTDMGPVISPESKKRIDSIVEKGLSEGAKIFSTGKKPQSDAYQKGNFIPPTIISDLSPDNTLSKTEIFGPVLSMMQVENIDDAISLINSGSYGNMACVFTKDGANARRFKYEVEAGNIGINIGVAAPMAFYPFSGWKDSFFGDLHGQGRNAIQFFTRQKVVVERWPNQWSRKF